MTNKGKFKFALKEMIKTVPLEEIDVNSLCKKCDCHRQTFYYYFRDLYDLVGQIFETETISTFPISNNPNSILSSITDYICSNFQFIKAVFSSNAGSLAEEFFFGNIYMPLLDFFNHKYENQQVACRNGVRRFARFYIEEIKFSFTDNDINPLLFKSKMNSFITQSLDKVLPSIIEMAKGETR